ncbi:hypothetical protein FB45DRAFT_901797 [Roridomyces roridus]|uniref:Uncharacterized protein n=1 Tax=Roridomyces roridus TaxID=1738132 RepID=A0AAD7C956_9AGAR|nr:hypothetical protein FB45DRAFT_901797 [Roridomyces roridus]
MPPVVRQAEFGETFELTCGAPLRLVFDPKYPYPRTAPSKPGPRILPITTAPQARTTNNTGCGTTVHTGAMPIRERRVWYASGEAVSRAVVFLPPEYFTERQQMELDALPRMDECGCMTVGVGCGICGNALGSLTTRCERHFTSGSLKYPTVYNFLPEAVSPPLPLPPRLRRVKMSDDAPTPAPAPELPCPTETPAPASNTETNTMASRRRIDFTAIFAQWANEPRAPSPTPSQAQADYEAMREQVAYEAEQEEVERQAAVARFNRAQKEGEDKAPTTQEALRKRTAGVVCVYSRLKRRKDGVSDIER